MQLGYALSAEELRPATNVEAAALAEEVGFTTSWISDHYHPWIPAQGESSFVWTVPGAVASRTRRIRLGTGVTCPTIRMHPAIVAQAAASTAALAGPGRFFLGVGSGEQLNEHVTGERWPPADERLRMLRESITILRRLWTGEELTHRGEFYTVEDAQLFALPPVPPPIYVSAFGPRAMRLAVDLGDGWVSTHPDNEAMHE